MIYLSIYRFYWRDDRKHQREHGLKDKEGDRKQNKRPTTKSKTKPNIQQYEKY